MKPTYTHNHRDGIKTDGSCPRCNSYAEQLADDMVPNDQEIHMTDNVESVVQILKTPPPDPMWYPES